MTHSKHPNAPNEHTNLKKDSLGEPYWQRAHRDWKTWIALVLMLVGIGVYIMTLDLSVRPPEKGEKGEQPIKQPTP